MKKILEFIKQHKAICIAAASVTVAIICGIVLLIMLSGTNTPVNNPSVDSQSAPSSSSDEPSSSEPSSEAESSEVESSESEPEPEVQLEFTAPTKSDITVHSPYYVIKGKGDPLYPLTINGNEIKMDESGYFALEITLTLGDNTVTYSHKEKSGQLIIRYKMIVIKEVSPSSAITVESVSDFVVSCVALKNSNVTATWNGESINLFAADEESGDTGDYTTYIGSFKTPNNAGAVKSYGKVKFSALNQLGNGTKTGGDVKVKTFDPLRYDGGNGYPKDSSYLNVGTTYVAEVICSQAETFNSDDATDLSRPTNNYLPKGTVDYCSPYTRKFKASGENFELYTLRYGKQVYTKTKNTGDNIIVYEGNLPDENNLELTSFGIVERHTVMTLKTDWKAPFKLEIGPQSYTNTSASKRDYTISEATFEHIDITFCYSKSGIELPDFTDNPLFSSAEIIMREYDFTLRLHLRQKGKFNGWSAVYNANDELEFRFLNPVVLKEAENEFGYSLEGVKVVIDAGHGGSDPGALGYNSSWHEAQLNLFLAKELESQLTALGATVIMTRTDNSHVSAFQRTETIRENQPNFVISVHRNANNSTKPSGFEAFHFYPYTSAAAHSIYDATMADSLYSKTANSRVKWHVFFLSRVSDCPVILTENGYVSNLGDYNNMIDADFNRRCASAMIKGMINYFNS